MHGLKVEYRRLNGQSLSRDLANHLYKRSLKGKIVVVTDRPGTMLASVRKQWTRIILRARIERARTLNRISVLKLSGQVAHMQELTFIAKAPEDLLEADVTFATADDFVRVAPECPTMYITYSFSKEKLHMIASWMPKHGLVIIYA